MKSPTRTDKYHFVLFISGMSGKSLTAVENLRKICEEYLVDNFEIEIIDLSRDEHLAVHYQIIAIPTLIKTKPDSVRTILGDLSDTSKVLRILEIES